MVTTTSTPVEQQTTPENRVVLKGVSWSTFKALLADVGTIELGELLTIEEYWKSGCHRKNTKNPND